MERSALLPHGTAANVAAMRARAPHHPALQSYSAIASLLTGRSEASVEDWVRALSAELNFPTLRTWGVTEADLRALLRKNRTPAVCKPIHRCLRRRS